MKSDKRSFILWISAGLLILLFFLSFLSVNKKDKREVLKTAYVNSKYENTIEKISISKEGKTLFLNKKNGIWFVADQDFLDFLPADQKKVESFIKELIKVRNLYKISDKIEENNSYGFDSASSFIIKYQTSSQNFPDLIFGNTDFSQVNRYFMTGKSASVYEADTQLDIYSSSSLAVWTEPYILSKAITSIQNEKDIQAIEVDFNGQKKILNSQSTDYSSICAKFLELRHGGAYNPADDLFTDSNKEKLTLKIELGNKTSVDFTLEPCSESSFKIHSLYKGSRLIEYDVKVSLWTYNKIKEIML
ncbi:MAG: DUF4340 domain-containing protein [Treponema sp.]|nr:DUF4340 domain-containing protein [Treponema sp.]